MGTSQYMTLCQEAPVRWNQDGAVILCNNARCKNPTPLRRAAPALYRLTNQPFAGRIQRDLQAARALLDAVPIRKVEGTSATGGLIGGV